MDLEELLKSLAQALADGMEISFSVKRPDQHTPVQHGRKSGNPAGNTVRCPKCGWQHTYTRADNARRGWTAHQEACPGRGSADQTGQWLKDRMKGKE